jgi:hypothetical protein
MQKKKVYTYQKERASYRVFDVAGRDVGLVRCVDSKDWYALKPGASDWEYGGHTRKGCVESCLGKKPKLKGFTQESADITLVRYLAGRILRLYQAQDGQAIQGVRAWSDWDWDAAMQCLPPAVRSWAESHE